MKKESLLKLAKKEGWNSISLYQKLPEGTEMFFVGGKQDGR